MKLSIGFPQRGSITYGSESPRLDSLLNLKGEVKSTGWEVYSITCPRIC